MPRTPKAIAASRPARRGAAPARKRSPARRAAVPAAVAAGPISLATVMSRADDRWRVGAAGGSRVIAADPSVDPALLEACVASGGHVVIDEAGAAGPRIVGALATAPALTIDRAGNVDARVKRFRITASDEALLRTLSSFLRVKGDDVEIFGQDVVTRARELCRLFGRMIKLN
jgi:hypothetical protein